MKPKLCQTIIGLGFKYYLSELV